MRLSLGKSLKDESNQTKESFTITLRLSNGELVKHPVVFKKRSDETMLNEVVTAYHQLKKLPLAKYKGHKGYKEYIKEHLDLTKVSVEDYTIYYCDGSGKVYRMLVDFGREVLSV